MHEAKLLHNNTQWATQTDNVLLTGLSNVGKSHVATLKLYLRAPLKIQFCEQPLCGLTVYPISSQYGVTLKKLSLTYQLYAALKFFTRALSCLET